MMMNRSLVLLLFYVLTVSSPASGKVILMRNNITLSFDDIEANFAASVKSTGEIGFVDVAEPLDACENLINKPKQSTNETSSFVLIIRGGGCSFEDKVRKAQRAGFKAAIIYDNEDRGILIAMAGNSGGIKIHAVFVTKETGEILKEYSSFSDTKLWLIPSFENSAWSIMAVSFISLLAMSAVLATCFFVRRHRIRRQTRSSRVREFHGMSRRLVKAMPSLLFTQVHEDNTTAFACAICLEDYNVGDKLRLLPCCHKFHAVCVDSWLTSWRTFCPVCKRDARTSNGEPPDSESTPLLSSASSSFRSSSAVSSFRSTSGAMVIGPSMGSIPTSISFSPAAHASSSSYVRQSFRSSSLRRSPPISVSRSSVDLRQQGGGGGAGGSPSPSQRSYISHMASPQSLGYPSISPLNARYVSPYRPSPSNASPGLVGSSSNYPLFHPLRYSESAGTFSPYASANSLPDC